MCNVLCQIWMKAPKSKQKMPRISCKTNQCYHVFIPSCAAWAALVSVQLISFLRNGGRLRTAGRSLISDEALQSQRSSQNLYMTCKSPMGMQNFPTIFPPSTYYTSPPPKKKRHMPLLILDLSFLNRGGKIKKTFP